MQRIFADVARSAYCLWWTTPLTAEAALEAVEAQWMCGKGLVAVQSLGMHLSWLHPTALGRLPAPTQRAALRQTVAGYFVAGWSHTFHRLTLGCTAAARLTECAPHFM